MVRTPPLISCMEHMILKNRLIYTAPVWHSSLSQQNLEDLEWVQKSALRVILQQKYKNCKHALELLEMDLVYDRNEKLRLNCGQKGLKNPKFSHNFKKKEKDI